MKKDCTELFIRYREIVRLVWNLGFWPHETLREYDAIELFRDTAALLFEGLILMPLGFKGRIEKNDTPGDVADFTVAAKFRPGSPPILVRSTVSEGSYRWNYATVHGQEEDTYRLRFIRFFDWYEMGPRDFGLLEVVVEKMDNLPELVGEHALLELREATIWIEDDVPPVDGPIVKESSGNR